MWKAKLVKIGGAIVAIALFVLSVTLPSTPWINENRAVYISIMAIFALAIGGVLWLVGIRVAKREEAKASHLHNIVPTLGKMDFLLREQALKESKEPFDIQKYLKLNNRINSEILGIKLDTVTSPEMAKLEMKRAQKQLVKEYRTKGKDLLFEVLANMSGALDGGGFGLKRFRDVGKYKEMMRTLTVNRNYVIDKELNKFIRKHISLSENFNNLFLAKERALNVKANYQNERYGIMDIMALPLVATISQFDGLIREELIAIRTNIGKRIEELEKDK